MPSELDRRDFLKLGVASIGGVAGCYTRDGSDGVAMLPGGGGDGVPNEDIAVLRLGPNESFNSVSPDAKYAVVYSNDLSEYRIWRA